MEITGIRLTDASAFVITFRNEDNSEFYIRPKSDFERELELEKGKIVYSAMHEGVKEEKIIMEMMKSGIKFYTYNYSDKTFTDVVEVDGNIKSLLNETKEDDINNLPLG